jgi:hypothetical protein
VDDFFPSDKNGFRNALHSPLSPVSPHCLNILASPQT